MKKPRKVPRVYKITHTQRKGPPIEGKNYYFRVTINNKRKTFKTPYTNIREAQRYVNKIFDSDESFNCFLNEQSQNPSSITQEPKQEPKQESRSVLDFIKYNGWLNEKTNPKYIAYHKQGKPYGERHARNVALALKKMFIDTTDYSWFSNKDLLQVTRRDAQKLTSELWQNRKYYGQFCEGDQTLKEKNGSYTMELDSLKSFFTFYFDEEGILETNPFNRIKKPVLKAKKDTPQFTKKQLQVLIDTESLISLTQDEKWKQFFRSTIFKSYQFVALTGMRSGEVRALTWDQIDENRTLIIDRAFKNNITKESAIGLPKWNITRKIVLCDSAYAIIKSIEQNKQKSKYVFHNTVFNAFDTSTWNKKFRELIEFLTLDFNFPDLDFTPKSFRGTLNSLLLESETISDLYIAKFFGWSAKTISKVQDRHYTKIYTRSLLSVAKGIEKIATGQDMLFNEDCYLSTRDIPISWRELQKSIKPYLLGNSELMDLHMKQKMLVNIVESKMYLPGYGKQFFLSHSK